MANVDLNRFKPGFALIASRAQVPIRLIVIRAPRALLPKGQPWWWVGAYPAWVEVELLGDLLAGPGESAGELTARAERQISLALTEP
jgi:1-acyl-sn-glycerol-3-phosphate acyltransferase